MNQDLYTELSGVTEKRFPQGISLPPDLNAELISVMEEITECNEHYDLMKKAVVYHDHPTLDDNAPDHVNYSQAQIELWHAAIGMLTEAIEINQAVWTWIKNGGGRGLDVTNIGEELADNRWYEAMFLRKLGLFPENYMGTNIEKLKARYPEGFSNHHAENRDIEVEREILEDGSTSGNTRELV